MLLLCACGLACKQKKKPHVLTEHELRLLQGLKETIAHFDTAKLPAYQKEEILQFNRYIIDSIEHQ